MNSLMTSVARWAAILGGCALVAGCGAPQDTSHMPPAGPAAEGEEATVEEATVEEAAVEGDGQSAGGADASAPSEPEAREEGPERALKAALSQMAPAPEVSPWRPPPSAWLGEPRSTLEASLKLVDEHEQGWVGYQGAVMVRYEEGVAVALMAKVPEPFGCKEAAAWLGFESRGVPLMRKEGCRWPSDSVRHGLVPGVVARFDFKTRIITVKTHP